MPLTSKTNETERERGTEKNESTNNNGNNDDDYIKIDTFI